MITITVDQTTLTVPQDALLLEACLAHDIYIPNLCHIAGMSPSPASCRLCWVEIDGEQAPLAACTVKVTEGLVVRTDTPLVRRLQRTALRLLLSVHDVNCKPCHANHLCALQDIARFLDIGLKPKGLARYLKAQAVDDSHPLIRHYPNRCVLCGRCTRVCKEQHGRPLISFAKRGFETVLSFHGVHQLAKPACDDCKACAQICPVGALQLRSAIENFQA